MDLLRQNFSAQAVAQATGATSKQVTDWSNLGLIVGQGDQALGKGNRRAFSFFNVMEIALGVALIGVGVKTPGDALRAAQLFAHSGDGGGGWVGTPSDPVRLPGLPFHYSKGNTFAYVARSECLITTDQDVAKAMQSLGNPGGLLVLNVSLIFADTMLRMGIDHSRALDDLYAEAQA